MADQNTARSRTDLTDAASTVMDPELEQSSGFTGRIIGAAIEVHRALGPGLAERIYADALSIEFADADIAYEREVHLPVIYKGQSGSANTVRRTFSGQLSGVARSGPTRERT